VMGGVIWEGVMMIRTTMIRLMGMVRVWKS
jgi:hypothetical protein